MLYLVRLDGCLKIGYSNDIPNRIKSFQTSCLNVEFIASREGTVIEEKKMHELCSNFRIKNELFKDNDWVINLFKCHIFEEKDIQITNLSNEIKKLRNENLKLVEENKLIQSELKRYINSVGKNFNTYNDNGRRNMFINREEMIETTHWFFYNKVFPHKGNNTVLVKYHSNIIEFEDQKLYYDLKSNSILTSGFIPAKSYPIGNEKTKYYYYDNDTSIKYEDILNIIKIIKKKYIKG